MAFEFVPILLILSVIAFITQFIDSALGMGFGTAATPILMILGYEPSVIVPAILLTELFAGIVVTIFHKIFENFHLGTRDPKDEKEQKEGKGERSSKKKIDEEKPLTIMEEGTEVDERVEEFVDSIDNLTVDSKVIVVLSSFAVIGAVVAGVSSVVFDYSAAFNLGVKIYIGVMIFAVGILLLVLRNRTIQLTWTKIISLAALAGFNKGISGGGYGPITVAGQILSGRDGTRAIASTLFSETIAVFAGTITYVLTHVFMSVGKNVPITWEYLRLAPYLLIGAVLAAPLAALVTDKLKSKWLKIGVGSMTILLGIFTLIRVILFQTGIWETVPKFVEMMS
ncbi:MAG: TSUP family transporter [Candidatus Heimdallarchaeota archaeon]|nr:TSUP family transporter [Candidatus Heimdallarchaeota archaeon]